LTRCHFGLRTLNQQGLWGGWTISDNRLIDGWDGISLTSWHNEVLRNTINVTHYGINLEDSEQNRVFENVISAGITGIEIYNQTDLKVYLNVIEGGRYGIQMDLCTGGVFENNTMSNATNYAVAVWSNTSTGNLFTWNRFIGNNGSNATYSTDHVQAMDLGANRWNLSGSPNGYGNYWSDWTSPSNGSGIVSSPYLLDGGANDFFPRSSEDNPIPGMIIEPWAWWLIIFVIGFGIVMMGALVVRNTKKKAARAAQGYVSCPRCGAEVPPAASNCPKCSAHIRGPR
jgi:parallel beta-helix repeat protein